MTDTPQDRPSLSEILRASARAAKAKHEAQQPAPGVDATDLFAGLGTPAVEPNGNAREFAGLLYGQYAALRQAGFHDQQAMTIMVALIGKGGTNA